MLVTTRNAMLIYLSTSFNACITLRERLLMNKQYQALFFLIGSLFFSLQAEEGISIPFEKTKSPARLKQAKASLEKVDLVATATTQQLKKSKPKKQKPSYQRWTIDKIVQRVNGVNILQSDLKTPRITKEGGPYTLDELTREELLVQKAGELHQLPTQADIDRQIVAFKIQNSLADMSDDEFEKQLKEGGFTLASYKNQLTRLIATENVRRIELNERLVITSQEVETFYKKNPVYVEDRYELSLATIPPEKIKTYKDYLLSHQATWYDLGTLEKDEIGTNFSFVTRMKPGTVSKPFKMDGQTKVIKLNAFHKKRLKTLDERYIEIEQELQEKKRLQYVQEIDQELRKKATIVNLT